PRAPDGNSPDRTASTTSTTSPSVASSTGTVTVVVTIVDAVTTEASPSEAPASNCSTRRADVPVLPPAVTVSVTYSSPAASWWTSSTNEASADVVAPAAAAEPLNEPVTITPRCVTLPSTSVVV